MKNHPGFSKLRESQRVREQKQRDSRRLEARSQLAGRWLLVLACLDALAAVAALGLCLASQLQSEGELLYSGSLLAVVLAALAWGLFTHRPWARPGGLWAAGLLLLGAAGLALFGPLGGYGWAGVGLFASAGVLHTSLFWPASALPFQKRLPPQGPPDSGAWQSVRARH